LVMTNQKHKTHKISHNANKMTVHVVRKMHKKHKIKPKRKPTVNSSSVYAYHIVYNYCCTRTYRPLRTVFIKYATHQSQHKSNKRLSVSITKIHYYLQN